MKQQGNTVLITGGSAGIGLEFAKLFSKNGNKVIITGRNQQRLDDALKMLENAVAIQSDVSDPDEINKLVQIIRQDHPQVNVLINNAGSAYTYQLGSGADTYAYAKEEISTNYLSIIALTDALLPLLNEKEQAAIVNVTSIVALLPNTSIPTYAASKAALHFYTQALRESIAGHSPVRVFEVFPPLVNTTFSKDIGGENGIPPAEVAEKLWLAFEKDQWDVPVGLTKGVYAAFAEAFAKLNG